jgi:hypothetical protein
LGEGVGVRKGRDRSAEALFNFRFGITEFISGLKPIELDELGVRHGVGADLDARLVKLSDLAPSQALGRAEARTSALGGEVAARVPNERGGEERGGGEAVVLKDGEGLGVKVAEAVVEGENDQARSAECGVRSLAGRGG